MPLIEKNPLLSRDANLPILRQRHPLVPMLWLLVVLLLISGCVRLFLDSQSHQQRVKVVGAGLEILPGTRIGYTSLHMIDMPKQYLTDEMFTSSDQVVGKMAKEFIPVGEPIKKEVLFSDDSALSADLKNGHRAITLRLPREALVDHNIQRGDRVDVLAIFQEDGKKVTRTICQDVYILAAPSRESPRHRGTTNTEFITLSASAADCEKLGEAAETAKLHLILRERGKHDVVPLSGCAVKDLLKGPDAEIAVPPTPPRSALLLAPPPPVEHSSETQFPVPAVWEVESFKGNARERVEFLSTRPAAAADHSLPAEAAAPMAPAVDSSCRMPPRAMRRMLQGQ
jgi:Flp pilus assembly protein CpaB